MALPQASVIRKIEGIPGSIGNIELNVSIASLVGASIGNRCRLKGITNDSQLDALLLSQLEARS